MENNKIIPLRRSSQPAVWKSYDIFTNIDRFYKDEPWISSMWSGWPYLTWLERWNEADTKISSLDLVDTGNKYRIITEIPGVSKKDLEVSITNHRIWICGETKYAKELEDEGYIIRERKYSTICRNMTFTEEISPDKANASLENGILMITVSKKSPTKIRKVPIK
jgi:HSP20 family protein